MTSVETDVLTFDDFTADPLFGPWYDAALSFSADGSEVAYVAGSTGLFGLYRQPVDGRPPTLVTDGAGAFVHTAYWSPDGRWIAYNADAGGDEAHQIFLIDPDGGPARLVTAAPGVQHRLGAAAWSPDSRRLAYAASGGDRAGVFVCDVATGESRRLAGDDGAIHQPGGWSPDGGRLLVVREDAGREIALLVVDVATGERSEVARAEPGVTFIPGPWRPHGESVLVLTNLGGEFIGLAALDLTSGEFDWVAAPAWDVERVVQSADGSAMAFCVNENGFSRVYLAGPDGDPEPVTGLPEGVVHGFALAPNGRRAAAVTSGSAHPYQVSVVDIATRERRTLLGRLSARAEAVPLVEAEAVAYPAADGQTIHGLLMRPPGGTGRHGVVIALHGGPHIQERPNYAWSGMYQYLVSQGVGVFAPNIRGSAGYGASFERLVVQRWGYEDVGDLESARAFLGTLDWVDPDRIGAFGFCYGGFVALSALVRSPGGWGAAVCWGPPSDLIDLFADATPGSYEARVLMVGDPVAHAAEMVERSPITHADRIAAPLLLIHGHEDPLVPIRQSDRLADKVRAAGTPVEYEKKAGHGFFDAEGLLTTCRSTAAFLVRHLGPAARS